MTKKKEPQPPTEKQWAPIRVHKEFADWLREHAEAEGRFMYHLLEVYVSKALGGKKPWEEKSHG